MLIELPFTLKSPKLKLVVGYGGPVTSSKMAVLKSPSRIFSFRLRISLKHYCGYSIILGILTTLRILTGFLTILAFPKSLKRTSILPALLCSPGCCGTSKTGESSYQQISVLATRILSLTLHNKQLSPSKWFRSSMTDFTQQKGSYLKVVHTLLNIWPVTTCHIAPHAHHITHINTYIRLVTCTHYSASSVLLTH